MNVTALQVVLTVIAIGACAFAFGFNVGQSMNDQDALIDELTQKSEPGRTKAVSGEITNVYLHTLCEIAEVHREPVDGPASDHFNELARSIGEQLAERIPKWHSDELKAEIIEHFSNHYQGLNVPLQIQLGEDDYYKSLEVKRKRHSHNAEDVVDQREQSDLRLAMAALALDVQMLKAKLSALEDKP